MSITKLSIHNFRSIKDITLNLHEYNLLVGENNSGKTTVINALRIFFDVLKFTKNKDFPKFDTADKHSWIELTFEVTEEESTTYKDFTDNGGGESGVFTARKFFHSPEKSQINNIYLTKDDGDPRETPIKKRIPGNLIYIPAVSRTEESMKLSGPSTMRDMLHFLMKKAVVESNSFKELQDALNSFGDSYRKESTGEGTSIETLIRDINTEIQGWGVEFDINLKPIRPEDIVKNLTDYSFSDSSLDQDIDLAYYGQGLQRHLIYTIVRLSAKYGSTGTARKSQTQQPLTLILFEEPEAFLHPSQQKNLHRDLTTIAKAQNHQILATSHSPQFVSKNIAHMSSIARLQKTDKSTEAYQISSENLESILRGNLSLYRKYCDLLEDPKTSSSLKKKIKGQGLGDNNPNEEVRLEEESLKYFLWLDSERAEIFFANHVVICEGATEKTLFEHLIEDREALRTPACHAYFLDALGKYNIHRHITLLSALGISHYVILDRDEDRDVHEITNNFIESQKTKYTQGIHWFDKDIEDYLGVKPARRPNLKPLQVLNSVKNGTVDDAKLQGLEMILLEALQPAQ
jgi:predicted ATP-dependent endonuclease of OLD family